MGKSLVINGANFASVKVETVVLSQGILIKTISSPLGGGVISGGGLYSVGDTVTLQATARTGYRFVEWSDGVTSLSRQITVTDEPKTYTALFEMSLALDWLLNLTTSNWENQGVGEVSADTYVDGFAIRDMLVGKTIQKIKFYATRGGSVDIVYYSDAPDISHFNVNSKVTVKTVDVVEGVNEVILDAPLSISQNNSALGYSNFLNGAKTVDLLGPLCSVGTNNPNDVGIVFGIISGEPFEYASNRPNTLGIDYYC